jgi:DNA-binding winged helix-turn-helix (wHTH) protein
VEHLVYIFEGFRLDAGRHLLASSGGVVVPLNSRAMDALVMLVSRAGELVTKRQLLDGVWPTAVVEDNNINQCILAIRKALGESAGSNRFVMTVPGRGYRFVAAVTVQQRESPEATTAQVSTPDFSRQRRTLALAVLATAIFVAVAIEILREQPQVPAAAQSADTLLACLQRHPDIHVQIQVRLMSNESGPVLWTGQYRGETQNLLSASTGPALTSEACRQLVAH